MVMIIAQHHVGGGGGWVKTRSRTCKGSRFGGKDCSALGQLSEEQPCNVDDCNGGSLFTLL